MATSTKPTVVENIQVLQVGKYGVRIDEKTWFGVNEPLTPSHFVPGGYKVSVTVSKTGKKYINEILGTEVNTPSTPAASAAPVAPVAVPAPVSAPALKNAPASSTAPSRAGYNQPLTEYDLAVQRQINRSSNWNAAMNSRFLGQFATNIDEYLAIVRKAADYGLVYTNE